MGMGQAYPDDVLPPSHRQALAEASDLLIDQGFDDVSAIADGDWPLADSTLGAHLPRRFALDYTPLFARQFFICLVTVAWKLAQPHFTPLTCVAEELAAWALINEAVAILEEQGEEANFDLFIDDLYEDTDFLILFDPKLDGLDSSEVGAYLGMGYLDFKDWFTPFGSGDRGAVHPYVQDDEANPSAS